MKTEEAACTKDNHPSHPQLLKDKLCANLLHCAGFQRRRWP